MPSAIYASGSASSSLRVGGTIAVILALWPGCPVGEDLIDATVGISAHPLGRPDPLSSSVRHRRGAKVALVASAWRSRCTSLYGASAP